MAEWYPVVALAPVAGLALYCLTHIPAARLSGTRSPYFSLVLGFASGLATTSALSIWALLKWDSASSDLCALLALNLVSYLALAFGYFNLVNMTIASLRIRILEDLLESGGEKPMDALLARHNTDGIITLRVMRLTGGGHLKEEQGRFYKGKSQFLVVARIFEFLRWMIIGPKQTSAARPAATSEIQTP